MNIYHKSCRKWALSVKIKNSPFLELNLAYLFKISDINSAHQKSVDRVTETVQFFVVITYTFVSELSKIMM